MPNDDPPTLETAIAAAASSLRRREGRTQDEVARHARALGLTSWTRSTVAALEAGQRDLSVTDLVALPLVLTLSVGYPVTLERLLEEVPSQVRLGESVVSLDLVRTVLAGRVVALEETATRERRLAADLDRYGPTVRRPRTEEADNYRRLWPQASDEQLLRAMHDAVQVAETKAAKPLGVEPEAVAVLAHRLWGRSLTAHRDALVAKDHPTGDDDKAVVTPRELQARRGHVTRRLLKELAAALREGQDVGVD